MSKPWSEILQANKDWSSPTPSSASLGVEIWQWLLFFMRENLTASGVRPQHGMLASLLPSRTVLLRGGNPFAVFKPGRYALQLVPLCVVGDSEGMSIYSYNFLSSLPLPPSCLWKFDDCMVVRSRNLAPSDPVALASTAQQHGICVLQVAAPMPLLEHMLLFGTRSSKEDVRVFLDVLGLPYARGSSLAKCYSQLASHAFPDKDEAAVMEIVSRILDAETLDESHEAEISAVMREALSFVEPDDLPAFKTTTDALHRVDLKKRYGVKRFHEIVSKAVGGDRAEALRSTPPWVHQLEPAGREGILRLELGRVEAKNCWTARYELTDDCAVPADFMTSLKQKTKTKHFPGSAGDWPEYRALRFVASWMWSKHEALFQETPRFAVANYLKSVVQQSFPDWMDQATCDLTVAPAVPVPGQVPAPAAADDEQASDSSSSSSS